MAAVRQAFRSTEIPLLAEMGRTSALVAPAFPPDDASDAYFGMAYYYTIKYSLSQDPAAFGYETDGLGAIVYVALIRRRPILILA